MFRWTIEQAAFKAFGDSSANVGKILNAAEHQIQQHLNRNNGLRTDGHVDP
jgi:hypothetical protein